MEKKKTLYHLRILKELAHLIKSPVIFNKSSKLDQITEGQQVCNGHKKGEKNWIILTSIVLKALAESLKPRIKHGHKCNKMLHANTKSSLHYTVFRFLCIRLNDDDTGAQRPFLGLSCSMFFNSNLKGQENHLSQLMPQNSDRQYSELLGCCREKNCTTLRTEKTKPKQNRKGPRCHSTE